MYINMIQYTVANKKYDLCSVDDHGTYLEPNKRKIFNKLFGYRYHYSSDETAYELLKAIFLKIHNDDPSYIEKLNYVINCHTTKVLVPLEYNLLYEIKNKFKLKNAMVFSSTNDNCCTIGSWMKLMSNILENDEQALLLTVDLTFRKTLKQINEHGLCSSGACAVGISRYGSRNEIISINIKSDSTYYCGQNLSQELTLSYNSDYETLIVEVILEALKDANIKMDQIKLIIPHNVNAFSWKNIAKLIKIAYEKIYIKGIYNYAHVFGADNFINLRHAISEGLIMKGDFYLMVNAGLGLVATAMVIKC